jgi:predicted phage gp36 major capsid-like protein
MADASPEERTRLERLRGAASDVGNRGLAEVLGKIATGQLGLLAIGRTGSGVINANAARYLD